MKKILMILMYCSLVYANGDDLCYKYSRENPNFEFLKQYSMPESRFTYDKGVAWFKRIGFMYSIGYDIFSPAITLNYTICSGIKNLKEAYMELAIFISKKRTIGIYQYSIERALKLYDSKEYQAEVERIVKKYCKDCKN